MTQFHMHGIDLYNAVRHLAPIARSSLNPNDRSLRMRCVDNNIVEFAAVGRTLTLCTYAKFDGESLDDTAVVEADVLYKMASRIKKKVVAFELKIDGEFEMSAGKVTTTFPSVEGPSLAADVPGEIAFAIPAALFTEVMAQALPYASSDDSRPALCGAFVDLQHDEPNVTATEGHRLLTRSFDEKEWTLPAGFADGVLLPADALKVALKVVDGSDNAADVEVLVGDTNVTITQDGVFRVDTERITASYPDFRQCLPSLSDIPVATFDAAELCEALAMGAPFVSKSEAVAVVYNGSVRVQIESCHAGSFDAELDGDFDGSLTTLKFNGRYLKQACNTLGDQVRQYVSSGLGPQVFVGADDIDERLRIVVMPMRL